MSALSLVSTSFLALFRQVQVIEGKMRNSPLSNHFQIRHDLKVFLLDFILLGVGLELVNSLWGTIVDDQGGLLSAGFVWETQSDSNDERMSSVNKARGEEGRESGKTGDLCPLQLSSVINVGQQQSVVLIELRLTERCVITTGC